MHNLCSMTTNKPGGQGIRALHAMLSGPLCLIPA